MSDDGTFILRERSRNQYFYVRHGGSYLDHVLLRGLDGFMEHLEETRYRSEPFLEIYLAGIMAVDLDAMEVMFRSTQFPASSALELKLLVEIIQHAWPDFRITPWQDPAEQCRQHFRLSHFNNPAFESPRRWTLEEFREIQEREWSKSLEEQDWSEAIAEFGEPVVRGWVEDFSHKSAAFIIGPEPARVHETFFCDAFDANALLCAGEGALEILLERPVIPIEDVHNEEDLASAYWIDLARREIRYWSQTPAWSHHPLRLASWLWPGWTFIPEPEGVLAMLTRLGRDPRVLLASNTQERLRKLLERLRPPRQDGPPSWFWMVAEDILARPCYHPLQS